MSESIPENADIRQLRTQAKELLRSLQSGETLADDIVPASAKLADAQRLIARKHGFSSWPKLVAEVETPKVIAQFRDAVERGDAKSLEKLLRTHSVLRQRIGDPVMGFDSPAIVRASNVPNAAEVILVLVRYGADPNARTKWWAGGFGALDYAQGDALTTLLNLGAKFDVWSAAVHGRIDVLTEILDRDPSLVSAPGGDGETPLHFAGDAATAEFLIERGADLEKRDLDHEGTPIQHQIQNHEIVRVLLKHGARPDIFTAVALDDVEMASAILAEDPEAVNAAVGSGAFQTKDSDGGHIYAYKIGPNTTPHAYAAKLGHRRVLDLLLESVSPARKLVVFAWLEDASAVDRLLSEHPGLGRELGAEERAITDAAQHGRVEAVRILLEAGADPNARGMSGGTALHVAAWFGHLAIVQMLMGRVPLDTTDTTFGGVPLGWAVHGAQNCRNPKGDYPGIVALLLEAGGLGPVNSSGTSLMVSAGNRADVKEVLQRFGVK